MSIITEIRFEGFKRTRVKKIRPMRLAHINRGVAQRINRMLKLLMKMSASIPTSMIMSVTLDSSVYAD